jgi:hypothetical protein
MDAHAIDLDTDVQYVWVTEAKYTGGSLYRKTYDSKEKFEKAMVFLTERASTDWVNGYMLTINIRWEDQ